MYQHSNAATAARRYGSPPPSPYFGSLPSPSLPSTATFYSYQLAGSSRDLAAFGAFDPTPRHARLTVAGVRDSACPLAATNPFIFGLIQDGCPIPGAAANGSGNGTLPVIAVVELASSVTTNGYYLRVM